jgi:hypothetical protein
MPPARGFGQRAEMSDEELLESLMIQVWAIYRSGGDRDLGAAVAVQMHEVCDRLPVNLRSVVACFQILPPIAVDREWSSGVCRTGLPCSLARSAWHCVRWELPLAWSTTVDVLPTISRDANSSRVSIFDSAATWARAQASSTSLNCFLNTVDLRSWRPSPEIARVYFEG